MSSDEDLLKLLSAWNEGSEDVKEELSRHVYHELRRMAARFMAGERASHTLQPTALVNEVFVQLLSSSLDFHDKKHFLCIVSRMMKRVLIDHARQRQSEKRGGNFDLVTLFESQLANSHSDWDVLQLDEAIESLSKLDSRKSEIIELSFFGGLTNQQIAELYSMSTRSVEREIQFAKAWLKQVLSE